MPYVFRIHKQTGGAAPNAATFQNGWGPTRRLAGMILDEFQAGQEVGRMGTSIPSIFARPILFETAFRNLRPHTYDQRGLNQQLVSEVFDMLEFLYQNAGSPKLSTLNWVAAEQIQMLIHSHSDNLRRLGENLQSNMQKIGNPAMITLFFWEDINADGVKEKVLIGGTSLSTMVFTSPNWARKAAANGWKFRRLDGSEFFRDDVRSLNARNAEFRQMIYNLRLTYNNAFLAQCYGNEGLAKYIWESMNEARVNITPMSVADYLNQYPAVRNIYAGQLPISHRKVDVEHSGYIIRPSSTRYVKQSGPGGAAIQIPAPMALNDMGLSGVEYVGGAFWQPTYKIDDAVVRTTPYYEREIPGDMGVKYPFITAFDLLEDKIIKVQGNIDESNFYTMFDGASKYLLPLKRLFFEFFNIDDLGGVHPHSGKKLVEIKAEDNGSITVTVNVPVRDSAITSIPLSREYSGDHIITSVHPIELGFFPFYKVVNRPSLDVYSVMLASDEQDTLDFYSIDPQKISRIPSTAKSRTAASRLSHNTKYYDVNGTISFVEVNAAKGVKALIIPKMREITLGNIHYDFAIDFGTSNTFIAYKAVGSTDINTLEFGNTINDVSGQTDAQVVFLYNPTELPLMVDTFQREFMLPTLGVEDSIASLPIKTAVCEVSQFENEQAMNLFGNINVGFKFKNEISAANIPNATYCTELKWALERDPGAIISRWRVLAFCKQILWLIKNKALLNGGDVRFNVLLTFPESMIDRSVFLDMAADSGVWLEAEKTLGLHINGFNRFVDNVTESEAPYYMVVTGNDNMLNVDIGGGTTDTYLVRRLDKDGNPLGSVSAIYSSVKFAADDLWSDGVSARINGAGSNGFYKYLQDKIQANNVNISNITRLVTESKDVMAALFSNESIYNTSLLIRQNSNLKSILLIHYTALLFSIGRLLKHFDAGIPRILSFTGMGSKYLSLISTNSQRLTDFTSNVLKMITGYEIPYGFQLDTHYQDAKEVTAKGALSKANVLPAYHIPDSSKVAYTDLGCEKYSNLTYRSIRIGTDVNAIRDDARKVFDQFVDLLETQEFGQLSSRDFQFSIPSQMLDDLRKIATASYNNVQGAIPAAYDQRAVTDNLFFWFLKDSLSQLSNTFSNNPGNQGTN